MDRLVKVTVLVILLLIGGYIAYRGGVAVGYELGAYNTYNEAYRDGVSDGLMACPSKHGKET